MIRLLLISIVFLSPLSAQPFRFEFERMGIEHGMSQSSVFSIGQDANGFLWLGTLDGLNRYDGYNFTIFKNDPNNSNSVAANNFYRVRGLSDGSVIASTQNNTIDLLSDHGRRVTRLDARSLSERAEINQSARCFLEGRNGEIYIGTKGRLIEYFPASGERREYPVDRRDSAGGIIADMVFGPDGDVWLATQGAPMRFDRSTKQFFTLPVESDFGLRIRGVQIISLIDDSGIFLAIYVNGEIGYFDRNAGMIRPVERKKGLSLPASSQYQNDAEADAEGNIWIGGTGGLYRLTMEQREEVPLIRSVDHWTRVETDSRSLSHNNILSLFVDREQTLWIGTTDGLNKLPLRPKKFTSRAHSFDEKGSIGPGIVWTFTEDNDGTLYVGTQHHVNVRKKGSSEFRRDSSVAPISLLTARDGSVWIGTRHGIAQWKDGKVIRTVYDSAPPEIRQMNYIYALAEDTAGIVWAATGYGLVRYDPRTEKYRRFFAPDTSARQKNFLMAVLIRRNGEMYVGTNGFGIAKFDPAAGTFRHHYSIEGNIRSLGNNVIFVLTETSDGTVWIGTNGGGINRMVERGNDSLEFDHYREADGFPNDAAYGILEDREKKLWISTNRGLVRFDPVSAASVLYTSVDGLQRNEFSQNAYYKNRDGKMFFGGPSGFNEFFPESLRVNPFVPPVAITRFSVFEKDRSELLLESEIRLRHDENFFSFDVAALSFVHPNSNRYSYRLEGLQEEWIDIGSRRSAFFTNIDPGEYLFRVRGSNNDGVWNEAGASVRIVILPPWWATVWFRMFAGATIVGTIAAGVWFYSRRKFKATIAALERQAAINHERQKTRDKIARDLHDDLASTVGSAGLFIETARRTLPVNIEQTMEYLEKTSSILNDAEEAMSDIVWSVSPKHDTLQSLSVRIRLVATDLCRARGIPCTVQSDGDPQLPLPEELRRGFYLIFKEGLNNALTHAGATAIDIRIGVESERLLLEIRDIGVGFDRAPETESLGGHGMANMKKRAEEIGAVLAIRSEKGKGTVIRLQKDLTQMSH